MSVFNKTCQICGKTYYACRKCEDINSPRQTTDKDECYGIYVILTALKQRVMNNVEAKSKLEKMGYTKDRLAKGKDNFLPEVYDWLADIVGTPVAINVKKKTVQDKK